MAFIFQENQTHRKDGRTDGRGSTLNAAASGEMHSKTLWHEVTTVRHCLQQSNSELSTTSRVCSSSG